MVKQTKASELPVVDGRVYHLRLAPNELANNVIVVGDPARADKVAAYFDKVDIRVQNREYVIRTGTLKGMPITVIATGIGTDNNEITLVEAYSLKDFNLETRVRKEVSTPLNIIRVGTCGGLQKENDVGTLAISSYSIGIDNTGLFYDVESPDALAQKIEDEAYRIITEATPDGRRFKGKIHPYVSKPDRQVVEALIRNVKGKYDVGITTTASGFFGPQGREIEGLDLTVPMLQEKLAELNVAGQRIINFEMESSLIFHLGAKLGYKTGMICPIIANRPKGNFLSDYHEAVDRAINTALDAMLEINYMPKR
jgi:uridine phosphorylase